MYKFRSGLSRAFTHPIRHSPNRRRVAMEMSVNKQHHKASVLLYAYPWQRLGNWKYMVYAVLAITILPTLLQREERWSINTHVMLLTALRYCLFQAWGFMSRLPSISRKYQIVKKGISFKQLDHETNNWDNILFLSIILVPIIKTTLPRAIVDDIKPWDGRGMSLVFLLHVGPVEWVYYWAHRALHHHYLYTNYHSHHHSSFVTQPITSNNHPFLEGVFYALLFTLPLVTVFALGYGSYASVYLYILFVDFMDAWGHCNFEFIPKRVFEILPMLKYIIYSPTFHSLHHTKVHTNFCLFMPIYDYIYCTWDHTTDELHHQVRKGSGRKVDCVYLSHPTNVMSIFHFPFGFQTFASQPYSSRWYLLPIIPLVVPIVLLLWVFASPFVATIHFIGKDFELQTWVIPRFKWQYDSKSQREKISGWIGSCILEAQTNNVKVIALGLRNKDQLMHSFVKDKNVDIPIVNGETMASIIIVQKVMACNVDKIFLSEANSRIGQAIARYLCENERKVMGIFDSMEVCQHAREKINPKFQKNLKFARSYEDGNDCKVWILGNNIDAKQQRHAPPKTWFHTFDVFPVRFQRYDCKYECVPSLKLPDYAKTTSSCEDILPRNVVRACYVAGLIHAFEDWKHNDFDNNISIDDMDKVWSAAIKHGFSLY